LPLKPKKKAAASPSPVVSALRLLGMWNRISQGHVALSAGCSCGVGTSNVRVQDFEEQILEYLQGKHGSVAGSIAELLTGIAKAPSAGATALLCDLERTIDSFEQQHRGG
jgi:hypothetical protein